MNPGYGIALKVASTFAFTLMAVCVKAVAERVPPGEIVFARSFFALIPIVLMLVVQGQLPGALRTRHPWLHVSRGIVGLTAMALNFWALAFLPLPEAMAIGFASPLLIVVLAALVLSERVRLFRWTAVAVGLTGVLIVLWPRFTLFEGNAADEVAAFGALLALVGALCSAFAAIFIRSMTHTEPTGTIVLYFALSSTLLALLSAPFGWVVPDRTEGVLLVLAGLMGGIGQILMTTSYREAPAATIAPFEYVSMLWGLVFGYLFFGESPTASVIVGGAIVIAAGIYIILREHRLGLERARQRAASGPPPAS